jgi:hypothetical protein
VTRRRLPRCPAPASIGSTDARSNSIGTCPARHEIQRSAPDDSGAGGLVRAPKSRTARNPNLSGRKVRLGFLGRFRAVCGPLAVPIPYVCHPVRVYVLPDVESASPSRGRSLNGRRGYESANARPQASHYRPHRPEPRDTGSGRATNLKTRAARLVVRWSQLGPTVLGSQTCLRSSLATRTTRSALLPRSPQREIRARVP